MHKWRVIERLFTPNGGQHRQLFGKGLWFRALQGPETINDHPSTGKAVQPGRKKRIRS